MKLSKLEITRMYGFIQMYPNEDVFVIKQDNSSGIGTSTDIYTNDLIHSENITDYDKW